MRKLVIGQDGAAAQDLLVAGGIKHPKLARPANADQEMAPAGRIGENVNDTGSIVSRIMVGVAFVEHDVSQSLAMIAQKKDLCIATEIALELRRLRVKAAR